MPNNFATLKLNQASEKFYLIRIVPRRVVNDDLVSIGGGKYTITFPYPIKAVKANATSLSLVTTVANPGEYSFDESTNLLTVYSTPSASNIIVVHYYLFYTGGRYRVVYEDPENTSTTLRNYQPKIKTNPTINNSIENVIVGNLAISSSSLGITNADGEFQEYLTDDDSFYKSEIKIWLCIDSIDNIQKIYDGRVSSLSISPDEVTINFDASLTNLLEPAFFGDAKSEVYWTIDDFANLDPNANNTPIPYFVGKASRYQTIPDTTIAYTNAQRLNPETLYRAVNTNYSTNVSTTTNRNWGIGRASGDGFVQFGFTPSAISNADPNYTRLTGTSGEIAKFRIGDSMVITQSAVDYYARVIDIDLVNNYLFISKVAAISYPGAVVGSNNCPSLVINGQAGTYYLLYGRDYTASVATTSGGNKYLSVTLVNNFEANHVGLVTFDVGSYSLLFRIRPDTTNGKHGAVLKKLLESAGLTVNAASVTAANAAFAGNIACSFPYFDEFDFKNYLEYLQDILSATLGYISLNNSFEIEYHLFDAPTGGDSTTDIDIKENSFKSTIKYQDLIDQIIAYNPHASSDEDLYNTSATPSVTETSLRAKHLHNISKTTRFRHILDNINDRLVKILGVRSNRYCEYSFTTKALNLDSMVGDNLLLVTNGILGNSSSKDLVIMGIDKNPKQTDIIATDLIGV